MVDQFIQLRFKNAAGNVQTFTAFGVSTNSLYFDSYEIRSVVIANPKSPEVSVTVGGNAAAVVKTTGYRIDFSVNLDNPQTLEKLRLLDIFVNYDRWTVEITVRAGLFIWTPTFDGYGLSPSTFSMNSILEFAPLDHQRPSFGEVMAGASIAFTARQTTIFTLPVATDVIAQAPSGGGN